MADRPNIVFIMADDPASTLSPRPPRSTTRRLTAAIYHKAPHRRWESDEAHAAMYRGIADTTIVIYASD